MVPHADVLGRLSSPAMRVGVVTAPAGYGKTAHAAVLLSRDERPAAWIDLEDRHCDPRVLLTDLVAALHSVTDLDSDGLVAGGSSSDQFATELAPSLGRALQRCTKPFLLILDDVHLVGVPPASDLLEALIANVPPGSAVVLVGRTCRLSALSRSARSRYSWRSGQRALALEVQDVAEVLAGMGVSAGVEEANRLVADTEGWPVGVRLAGLATLAGVGRDEAPGLTGGEAAVLDYFDSEWLGNLTDDERDFLRRVSVLDWMSGALCNAVLDRHDSGEVLHRIYAERHLVIPLDRRESAYRMHGLLRDALATDFERRNAPAVREVHIRASSWFEAEGDIDRAVRHRWLPKTSIARRGSWLRTPRRTTRRASTRRSPAGSSRSHRIGSSTAQRCACVAPSECSGSAMPVRCRSGSNSARARQPHRPSRTHSPRCV